MNLHIITIDYHRNGCFGTGFYVVLFDWQDEDDVMHRMVATVFPEPGCLAILDIDETAAGNIEFARGNSWRGDDFEPELRAAIAEHWDNDVKQSSIDEVVERVLQQL